MSSFSDTGLTDDNILTLIQQLDRQVQQSLQQVMQGTLTGFTSMDSGKGTGLGGNNPNTVTVTATEGTVITSTPAPSQKPPPVNHQQTPPPASTSDQSSSNVLPLSTSPQTTALTPDQSKQTAEVYISNLEHDFGLTRDQAAGIVANLWHESGGMNSGINQGGAIGEPTTNMADDNANGYGIAQWGGGRKQALIEYAKAHGLDPSSQAANYGYLKQELETTQSGAIDAVKATNSAQDATEAFCNTFERPSDPEMASRLADLQDV